MSAAARERVLASVRKALGVTGSETERLKTVSGRLTLPRPNLVPQRAAAAGKARHDLFTSMLEGQGARISRAKSPRDIPEIVAGYLREHNLPAQFRAGEDQIIDAVPWDAAPSLTRLYGRGQGSDAVTMSRAFTAAAETGTLFLVSGPDNPTTLNFLPDTHIAVIRAGDILGSYEDAWNAIRKAHGARAMPRTVNLVSGPSRTADIEQIIVMGAHGPRRLHVIILD